MTCNNAKYEYSSHGVSFGEDRGQSWMSALVHIMLPPVIHDLQQNASKG